MGIICALTFIMMPLLAMMKANNAQDSEDINGAQKPVVVATTAHIADLVYNIASESVNIQTIIKPGVDPHLYRPVRSDIQKFLRADLIIYNGQKLEGQIQPYLENYSKNGKKIIGIADNVSNLMQAGEAENIYDPHIWMDVKNWMQAVDIITPSLIELLPDNEAIFVSNAQNYKARLIKLDEEIRKKINAIPPQNRVLITAHDAFGYYGAAYGLEVIGIQGLSTASEAGLNQIENIAALTFENKIPAIFAETSVSNQNIRAIIDGAKAKGHKLELGGTLYSDSLGASGETSTYIGMMQHNTNNIAHALKPQNDPPYAQH